MSRSALTSVPAAEVFSISELAREFDITTRTIRYYEDQGLLAPERRGQKRVYNRADRTRLKLVLRGKRLGFPLEEIRCMIQLYDEPGGEIRQLDLMLEQLKLSRATLKQQREDLELQIREFDDIEQRCKQRLAQLRIN